MLVENKTLQKVKELGLNSYEAKIWTALLSRGVSTAGEISDIANVPRSRSYDVLESLEKKGFIIMKVGKPIQYIAVHPEEALDRLKKSIRKEAEDQVDILRDFEKSSLLNDLKMLHSEGIESVDPTEITGYLKSTGNIFDHLSTLLKGAKSHVKMSLDEKGVERMSNDLKRVLNKVEGNNISIHVAANIPTEMKWDNVTVKGANLDGRFVVVDSQKVMFFITPNDTHHNYETAVWIESPVLAQMFENVFDNAWKDSNVKVDTKLKAKVTKKVQN